MPHVVIGTAGHIDHGKSSLVQALTGTDPDRLQEEKARGITIDLGFAHTTEGDVELSFVDVPGHERFVRNMLAGVGGMDLVMLHVAADESVMPQTREHFDICRLLHVPSGIIVITKSDLADAATLDVVRLEVAELVAGTFLEDAPVLAVSARTGEGLPELRRALAAMASRRSIRGTTGLPRLPIDRVFSIKGFGTVVTGTLVSGDIRVEDELLLQPSGRRVKVRGLQVHGRPATDAPAGRRVAVNLAGVEVADVERGETLAAADAIAVTRRVDLQIELLPASRALRHGGRVRFHQGTRELIGRIALSSGAAIEPGASAFARLHLEAPAVLTRGDRFILRSYSPVATIGGGTVLDPLPPRRGVRTAAARARFARLADRTDAGSAVLLMVEEAGLAGLPASQLSARAGLPACASEPLVPAMERAGTVMNVGSLLVASSAITAVIAQLRETLAAYHARHPHEEGIPREELRERLFATAPSAVFDAVLTRLVNAKTIVARDRVALAGHSAALSDEESRARDGVLQVLSEASLTPPDRATLAQRLGTTPQVIDRIVTLLVRQKALVRAGDLLFHESALARLKEEIRALKADAVATLDVATFKDRYQVSRKYAIPLMEYLDRERVTRRVGDTRHIL